MGNSGDSGATKPTVHAGCFIVSIIHRTLTWTTGSLTCVQMLGLAIAHGGGGGVLIHVRESALEADWEENPLPHRGIKPASAASQSNALTN